MGQDRDIKMNFGKMVDFNKLIDLVANQEKKKSTITSNIVINQSVNGTDDVLKAAKANQELITSLGGLKKVTTELKQALKFKSSSKEDTLSRIAKISSAYDKTAPGEFVQMVNAYRAQYDDWEKLTEDFFSGITKIRDRYNKIISSNKDKNGRQTYADDNYSLSPQRIKGILDKYSPVQHPQLWLKFDLNLNEDTIISEYQKRREALIQKLTSLDKGKFKGEFGYETEKLIFDGDKDLRDFVSYYAELEELIKEYGGEIPDRIREIYNAIQKENEDGTLRLDNALKRGKTAYKDFFDSLKEYGKASALESFSTDAVDDIEKKISSLDGKIGKLFKSFKESYGKNIKNSGEDENYYLNKINSFERMMISAQNLRQEISELQSHPLCPREPSGNRPRSAGNQDRGRREVL